MLMQRRRQKPTRSETSVRSNEMTRNKTKVRRSFTAMAVASWMTFGAPLFDVSAQRQRSSASRSTTTRTTTRSAGASTATRSTTTHHTTATTTAGYHHGSAVYHGGTAYHGTTVHHGDEGYAAVGPRGAVVAGEEGAAAVTRHGAVVVGEEGYAAKGRSGNVVVGETYESHDAWRTAAAVTTGIAIGTMLAHPPPAYTTTVVSGTTYYISGTTYYRRVYVSGVVHYQVVARPF
jgi:hypothetical protein